jgi:hypothetical protein
MDAVFRALADPHRRTILDRLHGNDALTLGQLCEGLAMTRQAVSKHHVSSIRATPDAVRHALTDEAFARRH